MITEKELKLKCTPDIIKKMLELAEGFELFSHRILGQVQSPNGALFTLDYNNFKNDFSAFPLLIHRAVEGWNKFNNEEFRYVHSSFKATMLILDCEEKCFEFVNYQPENLTQLECALLHCLINILKEEVKGEV